jgi:glycosyltransferase involved in cell wall biosynthesis
MRIIYLHQYFNTPDMSGGSRSYEIAKRLVSLGHTVHMITSWRDNREFDCNFQTNVEGIFVYWIPVPYSNNMGFWERIRAFLVFAVKSARIAIRLKADLIFASSTPLTIAFPAVYASRRQNIPMVFEIRDLWPEMPIAIGSLKNPLFKLLAKLLERWTYRNAMALIALSPGIKEGILRLGYPNSCIAVIPNGCNIKTFSTSRRAGQLLRSQRDWLGSKPLLIYAGTMGKVNKVDYMVALALELYKLNSNVQILLVGDGNEKEKFISKAKLHNVFEKNLFVESSLPKDMMPALFSACTMSSNLVIDLPQARANSANKFFDTLAAGKPIFLNHGGWMYDLVENYKCGINAWGRPIKEVALLLDQRLNDANWLNSASISASNLARTFFDYDTLALQFEKVLIATFQGHPERSSYFAPGDYKSNHFEQTF